MPLLTFVLPKVSSIEEESEPEYHQLFEYAFVVGLKEGKDRKGRGRGKWEEGGRRKEREFEEEGGERVSMRRRKEREFEEEGGERVRGGRVSMRRRKEEV